MSGRRLLRGVRVFDPGSSLDAPGRNVLLVHGEVSDLNAPSDAPADEIVEAQGKLLIPGLVDLRTMLHAFEVSERDPVESALEAGFSGGYTTLVLMPAEGSSSSVGRGMRSSGVSGEQDAERRRVLMAGPLTVGEEAVRLAEFGRLSSAGYVVFCDPHHAVPDSRLLRFALETAKDLGVLIMTHAEDDTLAADGVMHEGRVSVRLGLSGIPSAAELIGVHRDIAVAELTGGRLHLAHLSTPASAEAVLRAKNAGVSVTADVTPLHLFLTDRSVEGFNPMARLSPPLRSQEDADGLLRAVETGAIDAVASDHFPRSALQKSVEFENARPGAIGLETAIAVLLTLSAQGKLSLARAVSVLTRGPADVLGREDLGRIREGGPADLALVDLEHDWTFSRSDVGTRAFNSPLMGASLRGRVWMTIAAGHVVYRATES
jgi:dihydroorotase